MSFPAGGVKLNHVKRDTLSGFQLSGIQYQRILTWIPSDFVGMGMTNKTSFPHVYGNEPFATIQGCNSTIKRPACTAGS